MTTVQAHHQQEDSLTSLKNKTLLNFSLVAINDADIQGLSESIQPWHLCLYFLQTALYVFALGVAGLIVKSNVEFNF